MEVSKSTINKGANPKLYKLWTEHVIHSSGLPPSALFFSPGSKPLKLESQLDMAMRELTPMVALRAHFHLLDPACIQGTSTVRVAPGQDQHSNHTAWLEAQSLRACTHIAFL